MSIPFMKWIDEYVGRVLCILFLLFPRPKVKAGERSIRNILVIKFWGIGSVTLSMPLLSEIRSRHPEAHICYLTLSTNATLCSAIQEIDDVCLINVATMAQLAKSFFAVLREVRAAKYDSVYDLEFFTNISAIIARFSRAPLRIGFVHKKREHDFRSHLYSATVEFSERDHTARNFLNLFDAAAPLRFSPFKGVRHLTPSDHHFFPVLLNINASKLAYERRWDRKNFLKFSLFLIEHYQAHLYLTGTTDEIDYVAEFAGDLEANITNLCGRLSVEGLISLIDACALVVTNDSGPLHLASALNKPTIAFFGPETPLRYGSLADKNLTFYAGLWCSPCMTISNLKTVNCINRLECMKQITVGDVIEQSARFIDEIFSFSSTMRHDPVVQSP